MIFLTTLFMILLNILLYVQRGNGIFLFFAGFLSGLFVVLIMLKILWKKDVEKRQRNASANYDN